MGYLKKFLVNQSEILRFDLCTRWLSQLLLFLPLMSLIIKRK